MLPYEKLVEKISQISGKEKEEIERLVEAKRAKLSGLVSKEGAAQIIASQLGINFEKEKLKISEIMPGIKKINLIGKIIKLFPVRSYEKNERKGKIASFIIADETGNIRVILWDTNHIELIEKEKIKENDIVEISGASLRNNEIHLSGLSDIKLSNGKIENIITEISYPEKNISELKIGENVKLRAFVVQAFEPKFFEICPECSKKAINNECQEHGKIIPTKRALLTTVLDDGTETIRAVMFSEQLGEIGLTEEHLENSEKFLTKKTELLGEEKFFSGAIRENKIFNNPEIFISNIEEINTEKLIEQLEKKV